MRHIRETSKLEVGGACLQGILIRLGLSVGLLALAVALASRFA